MMDPRPFRFPLAPTPEQARVIASQCCAVRFALNHFLAYVKAVMDQRDVERTYGIADEELTPSLDWCHYGLRAVFNARKHEVAPWWRV